MDKRKQNVDVFFFHFIRFWKWSQWQSASGEKLLKIIPLLKQFLGCVIFHVLLNLHILSYHAFGSYMREKGKVIELKLSPEQLLLLEQSPNFLRAPYKSLNSELDVRTINLLQYCFITMTMQSPQWFIFHKSLLVVRGPETIAGINDQWQWMKIHINSSNWLILIIDRANFCAYQYYCPWLSMSFHNQWEFFN